MFTLTLRRRSFPMWGGVAHLAEAVECRDVAGLITLPPRHNGLPYGDINVLMQWAAASEAGY